MNKLTKLLAGLGMASVLIAGCKKDDFVEFVGKCPVVITTNPSNGASFVPLSQVVTATFNEKMNSSTITSASFTLQSGTSVAGSVTYTDSTASFTPASALIANTTYTARIKSTVKDLRGNGLQADYIWSFSTGAIVSPAVISTDPVNNETGVVLNKTITATFNMPMDPLTITGTTFTLKDGLTPVAGSVSYSGTIASFTPGANLSANTVYTATITTGAKNTAGNSLLNDYVWNFTTGLVTAPTVISTDPANSATGVPLNKVVTATFSEPMDPLTITGTTFTLKDGTTAVSGTVTYSGSIASFTPSANLLSGTTYTATITTGAKNVAGTPLANNYVWSFSTVVPLGPGVVDLQSVARFGIISGVGVSNQAGPSEIHDLDVGIYPGARSSITGFFDVDGGPGLIFNGAFYAADDAAPIPAMLLQAKNDLTSAYQYAEGATSPAPATVSGDLGGTTLAPGIYKSTSTLSIQSGNLTLDAQGDINAVWIFQIASDFTTMGGSPYPSPAGGNVILIGGAQAKNIFWQVGASATIGDYTSFQGTILALTSVTMNAYSRAVGRMLCSNGAVVLTSTNIINKP